MNTGQLVENNTIYARYNTQLSAWRPISLLSTLGKGLERFLAQQMAARAIQADLLAPCNFGALPGRSAMDLVQVLVHRVEEAFQQGKEASLLLLDVKGAFDAVIHQQLLSHLHLQGWYNNLVQLVKDWLTSHTASVHIKEYSATVLVKGGLPQGSPLPNPLLTVCSKDSLYPRGFLQLCRRYGHTTNWEYPRRELI